MTAFTPNTGAVVNWETLSGGSVNASLDSYAISNGTTLLINTDSYLCTNHSALFGSVDTVSFTGTGGKLKLDGTSVRVIPYTGGSGNVPAIGTAITQGGVSGYFLGAWASWLVEPTASGSAMPATGFIKIKTKTGGSFAAGALAGISATASGPDVVGWIEVRGADTATITVPRVGAFEVVGDWFELGLTTGARGQVLPCPTCATVAGVFPGVWIETAAGSGVFDRYTGAGSQVALATTRTDASAKLVWQTTGGIRIGNDGTNGVGYLPPTGCRVRIPNVIMTCCTRTAGSGSGPRVLPNATLTTRQEFVTTAAGDISISGAVFQWYGNFLQAYRADVVDSAVSDSLVLQEIASPLNVSNVIVSPTQAQLNYALNLVSCFGGGTIQNNNFWRFSLASASTFGALINYATGVTFSGNVFGSLTLRGNAGTGVITSTQAKNCTFSGNTFIGGHGLFIGPQGCTFTNTTYYDHTITTTTTSTNPMYVYSFTTGGNGNTVEGITLPLPANGPYAGLVGLSACYSTLVKNIGTFAAPLTLNASVTALGVNALGNNDGITIKRMFLANTRTGPYAFVNSDTGILVENCAGDYADTTVMAGLNAVEKSVAITSATSGQTSVYGSHWKTRFTSATAGFTEITCNEPTLASAAQCAIAAGAPQFNSSGSVLLTKVGDQVVWEMPFFAKGFTAFTNSAPVITGTNVTYSSGARWGNHDIEFQIDTGSGYGGTWLALTAANLTAQAITQSAGFRLKVRVTCATANAGNVITNMRVAMTTSSAAQSSNTYPLQTVTLSLTGLVAGSDVVILQAGTTTILESADSFAGTTYGYTYETLQNVDIGVIKPGFVPLYIRNFPLAATDASLPIAQTADRNYSA